MVQGPLPSWDTHVHYVMSDDFFKTPHEKLVSCGNQFDIISHKVKLTYSCLDASSGRIQEYISIGPICRLIAIPASLQRQLRIQIESACMSMQRVPLSAEQLALYPGISCLHALLHSSTPALAFGLNWQLLRALK